MHIFYAWYQFTIYSSSIFYKSIMMIQKYFVFFCTSQICCVLVSIQYQLSKIQPDIISLCKSIPPPPPSVTINFCFTKSRKNSAIFALIFFFFFMWVVSVRSKKLEKIIKKVKGECPSILNDETLDRQCYFFVL